MRLSRKKALEMGLDLSGASLPARERSKAQKINPAIFIALCREHGLPEPVPELLFAYPLRLWRFDWAWLRGEECAPWIALEVQGGLFVQGRHSRGAALLQEHQKLNDAACRGWRVLFCTPADVKTGKVFEVLKRALLTPGVSLSVPEPPRKHRKPTR